MYFVYIYFLFLQCLLLRFCLLVYNFLPFIWQCKQSDECSFCSRSSPSRYLYICNHVYYYNHHCCLCILFTFIFYFCNVCCCIFVYLFIISFMLVFVVILRKAIICKQVYCFCSFCLHFNVKQCKSKTPVSRFFNFRNKVFNATKQSFWTMFCDNILMQQNKVLKNKS